jgi:predicted dehydrogenase
MNETKVALIGAGYMALEHAKAFGALPGVRIAGVCGRDPARARALADAFGTTSFKSVEAMYAATAADIVVVAVNELSMQAVCSQVFKFPWLSLLEKPVGVDLAQAKEILAAAQATRARCRVALNRRAYAATRQAVAELEKDGSPRLISVLDQQDMSAARSLGQPARVVQNWMYANSIHLVDYFATFARGELIAVHHGSRFDAAKPGHVVATLQFSSGDCGVYQAIWNGPGPWAVTVTNAAVRIELRPLEKLLLQKRGERRSVEQEADPLETTYKAGLYWQAAQVVAEARGQHAAPLATLMQATQSMDWVARIYGTD